MVMDITKERQIGPKNAKGAVPVELASLREKTLLSVPVALLE